MTCGPTDRLVVLQLKFFQKIIERFLKYSPHLNISFVFIIAYNSQQTNKI